MDDYDAAKDAHDSYFAAIEAKRKRGDSHDWEGRAKSFLDGRVTLYPGDCLDVMRRLPDCSIDSVVTADAGSAARFFYTAKADADDRIGSKHPTVKPLDLMQYLCRLVTPPSGTVLDPFAGTGTTGEAAWREGFKAVLIEREEEYQADIAERMRLALAGPDEKSREIIKRKGKTADAGPLFGGTSEVAGGGRAVGKSTATSAIRTHDRPDRSQAMKDDAA